MFSCNRDANNPGPSGAVSTILRQGNWIVSEFSYDGNDRLFLFGGYQFSFAGNGNVLATKGTVSAMGTWSSGTINGNSTLFFDFASSPNFSQLNGNWQALDLTNFQIRFQRTNPTTSGTDNLTLQSY